MFKEKVYDMLKKYSSEFILTFVSVIIAFTLTEWSSNQGEKISETKIIFEIKNGINTDLKDLQANIDNYKISSRAIHVIRNWLNQKEIPQDSVGLYYYVLFRNFSPIINKTGYESLKETNLKTITNDSLRFQIITLYDYHYKIIEKLEDNIEEMQDFKNYFAPVNNILHQYMVFSENGKITKLNPSGGISESHKKEILSYLWRMENNRRFKLLRYEGVMKAIHNLNKNIDRELK
jgi:hypothetical protein